MTKFACNALKIYKILENDDDDYKVTTRTARAKLAVKNCSRRRDFIEKLIKRKEKGF